MAPSFGLLLGARLIWGLGAAAPAGLRSAITRDLYSGDAMARVTTIMMAVFLLGPVFMPLVGEALLQVAPWRAVFWFSTSLAIFGAVWCVRFGETLDPANRRPLEFSKMREAVVEIVGTPLTFWHLAANVFLSGAFFIFLGSAQPVFDNVYDRAGQFALMFALIGVVTIPALLVSNRLLARIGSRRVSLYATAASMLLAVVGLVQVIAADGRPSFWLWYVWLAAVSALVTVATPAIQALALEPMGELAGTTSALMYFTGFAFGAGLAAIFDALIDQTVTPFVLGYALYITIGFGFLLVAGSPDRESVAA
jgi:DHA1 family bicyclomycin/chloramphenicol resistance-like MFS transporter